MRKFNYKCTVSKNGSKMYYKKVNSKWQRISNKVGMKAEKGKRKYNTTEGYDIYDLNEIHSSEELKNALISDDQLLDLLSSSEYDDELDFLNNKIEYIDEDNFQDIIEFFMRKWEGGLLFPNRRIEYFTRGINILQNILHKIEDKGIDINNLQYENQNLKDYIEEEIINWYSNEENIPEDEEKLDERNTSEFYALFPENNNN